MALKDISEDMVFVNLNAQWNISVFTVLSKACLFQFNLIETRLLLTV